MPYLQSLLESFDYSHIYERKKNSLKCIHSDLLVHQQESCSHKLIEYFQLFEEISHLYIKYYLVQLG